MSISIVDQGGVLTDALREMTERRLLFALSRFDPLIQRISIIIADSRSPRGEIHKSCCVTVKLRELPDVIVTNEDSDVICCITRAADRAGRAVRRSISLSNGRTRAELGAKKTSPVSLSKVLMPKCGQQAEQGVRSDED